MCGTGEGQTRHPNENHPREQMQCFQTLSVDKLCKYMTHSLYAMYNGLGFWNNQRLTYI